MKTHIIIMGIITLQADTMEVEDTGEMMGITTETIIPITMITEYHIITTIITTQEGKFT